MFKKKRRRGDGGQALSNVSGEVLFESSVDVAVAESSKKLVGVANGKGLTDLAEETNKSEQDGSSDDLARSTCDDDQVESVQRATKKKKKLQPALTCSTAGTASQENTVGHKFASSGTGVAASYGGGVFAINEIDSAVPESGHESHEVKTKSRRSGTIGPLSAPANLRITSRFDYQQDVCKDYKQTGYCGYGDNCIYVHDRGDYKTGWELEQEWSAKQKANRDALHVGSEKKDSAGPGSGGGEHKGLPFACHICRKPFTKPVVTLCGHYFCQTCAFAAFSKSSKCKICGKDTKGIFNAASNLPLHPEPN